MIITFAGALEELTASRKQFPTTDAQEILFRNKLTTVTTVGTTVTAVTSNPHPFLYRYNRRYIPHFLQCPCLQRGRPT